MAQDIQLLNNVLRLNSDDIFVMISIIQPSSLKRRFIVASTNPAKCIPTDEYKQFLLYLFQCITTNQMKNELTCISQFLSILEQEGITGLIPYDDPEYVSVLHALYNDHDLNHLYGKDRRYTISNSDINNIIRKQIEGCSYYPCKRQNPIHKKLLH